MYNISIDNYFDATKARKIALATKEDKLFNKILKDIEKSAKHNKLHIDYDNIYDKKKFYYVNQYKSKFIDLGYNVTIYYIEKNDKKFISIHW